MQLGVLGSTEINTYGHLHRSGKNYHIEDYFFWFPLGFYLSLIIFKLNLVSLHRFDETTNLLKHAITGAQKNDVFFYKKSWPVERVSIHEFFKSPEQSCQTRCRDWSRTQRKHHIWKRRSWTLWRLSRMRLGGERATLYALPYFLAPLLAI